MESKIKKQSNEITGKFVTLDGEKYYLIENVDRMAPFFISVVSASNHWLFISSTGSLTAGRIKPENALFPYKSVDYIHESAENTGSKTLVRVTTEEGAMLWEPFNTHHDGFYQTQRNIYKNAAGDKIVFEEVNEDLSLTFKYQWSTSDKYGFVRTSTLTNHSSYSAQVEIVDGIQNILPSGAPLSAMQDRSALVDAYKWNELLSDSVLATYSMYAKLSDRAEPAESLRATTVFSIADDCESILLSSEQLGAFRRGGKVETETLRRGLRGAYFVCKQCDLAAGEQDTWQIIADIDKTHTDVVELNQSLITESAVESDISRSVRENHKELLMLMSGSDAWQKTAEEETTVHHYANVLFNNMRGGVVVDNYWVDTQDFVKTLTHSSVAVATRNSAFLAHLPERIGYNELLGLAEKQNDNQLVRLCYEYLPLTFGRRHGDPSRPWNHFEIKVKDKNGERLLSYQGNWRDIFQNWEALAVSYPNFIKSFIAKFVNASTADGYNPYRITKEGVDWEVLEPEDPWSNIGYWGDHQIIYLLKFLELSKKYQPQELSSLLSRDIFSYANVPYEIKAAEALFNDPKNTVDFNQDLHDLINGKVEELGSDGRLLLNHDGDVYLVNLTEKMMVPLLAKLGNLVVDGGVWLNTQRPEWNDANNAIVGNGLSMVTLYYMRRYVTFMQELLRDNLKAVELSSELVDWIIATSQILAEAKTELKRKSITRQTRKALLSKLAGAASDYRTTVYENNGFSGKTKVDGQLILQLLDVSLDVIDEGIAANRRQDGLYNAYNIISYSSESASVEELYPMLEGQVAVLSSGVLSPEQAVALLDNLYASEMFREDQQSFMLYPDRELTCFMNKNKVSASRINANGLLKKMVHNSDHRLVEPDADGSYHFNADFENAGFLLAALDTIKSDYKDIEHDTIKDVVDCYEEVFNHQAFTGRSGTMFGYEGLGCIYWHMVSKLLLAVQENYFASWQKEPNSNATQKLAEYYYKVRSGIGFNKTPENYGAFPTDPYSHTPKHAGAQQPGMTGQVKEEILTRFGELGVCIEEGLIHFKPSLLRNVEFLKADSRFDFINIDGENQTMLLPKGSLAFTYCQIPVVYRVVEEKAGVEVVLNNNDCIQLPGVSLDMDISRHLFARTGEVKVITVSIPATMLMG
ncbi:hypothetical protein [Photobacterium lutimaris]|uniref:Cellobiose phosphorylase n=1 Tax=Photobacterium lutimaris TaxID=388278 RepID=A0A2T3J386_9GAMM|nr:hypothetical protein [Photobacterium lutimaris]PSU35767.1 hypothetical protein C9I99_01750 [Photobacterium lutimaris]TDR78836.1 hypothetical protein DFP78_101349 [Photobacterium lutimaris]